MSAHLFFAVAAVAVAMILSPQDLVSGAADRAERRSVDRIAQTDETAIDVAGVYQCEGTSKDGESYRGFVDIVRHAATYQLMWMLATGEQQVGLGLLSGDGDNLAVSYFGSSPGIVSYRIQRDRADTRLVGQWTAVGADGHVYSETLTRIGPSSNHLYFRVLPKSPTAPLGNGIRRPA